MLPPDDVRRQAVHPWTFLPPPPEIEFVEVGGATVGFMPWPTAQMIRIDGDGPTDVPAAVEAARAAARERGKKILAWWVPPEHDRFAAELERCGLVNEDTPGFEAIENAMALLAAPAGEADPAIEVHRSETWEDFVAGNRVVVEAFGMPDVSDDELRERYAEYTRPDNPGRGFVARVDGQPVGNAFAVPGSAGVNLFGGAVLESARGRGVYRALVQARWRWAVELDTPALTVQAGRMSRPILERLGFELVEPVRVYVDDVS